MSKKSLGEAKAHKNLVRKTKELLSEYGFFILDSDKEMLKYLRETYRYAHKTVPDLICVQNKAQENNKSMSDFIIEVKSGKNLTCDDEKQLKNFSSCISTYLLVERENSKILQRHKKSKIRSQVGLLVFDKKRRILEQCCPAFLNIVNFKGKKQKLPHRILEFLVCDNPICLDGMDYVLFTDRNPHALKNSFYSDGKEHTTAHYLDYGKFGGSWKHFKNEFVNSLHKLFKSKKITNSNSLWGFSIGLSQHSSHKTVFGYGLPSFIVMLERIVKNHDTGSQKRPNLRTLDDQCISEPWHNTDFFFYTFFETEKGAENLQYIRGKLDFLKQRGRKARLVKASIEDSYYFSDLIHTSFIQEFSEYLGINPFFQIDGIDLLLADPQFKKTKTVTIENPKSIWYLTEITEWGDINRIFFMGTINNQQVGLTSYDPKIIQRVLLGRKMRALFRRPKQRVFRFDGPTGISPCIEVEAIHGVRKKSQPIKKKR